MVTLFLRHTCNYIYVPFSIYQYFTLIMNLNHFKSFCSFTCMFGDRGLYTASYPYTLTCSEPKQDPYGRRFVSLSRGHEKVRDILVPVSHGLAKQCNDTE